MGAIQVLSSLFPPPTKYTINGQYFYHSSCPRHRCVELRNSNLHDNDLSIALTSMPLDGVDAPRWECGMKNAMQWGYASGEGMQH